MDVVATKCRDVERAPQVCLHLEVIFALSGYTPTLRKRRVVMSDLLELLAAYRTHLFV